MDFKVIRNSNLRATGRGLILLSEAITIINMECLLSLPHYQDTTQFLTANSNGQLPSFCPFEKIQLSAKTTSINKLSTRYSIQTILI